ncbi:Potassium/Sodium Hyperpolarization-Activated Cyclic Nucleotide-Gated Channel 3 [Manis pentadactyla]|nr:Potassium/Sodium Hyperpolarization-Activated Cyclic Nucleotide-Gated Channel 3 [Manis pentadactyla]
MSKIWRKTSTEAHLSGVLASSVTEQPTHPYVTHRKQGRMWDSLKQVLCSRAAPPPDCGQDPVIYSALHSYCRTPHFAHGADVPLTGNEYTGALEHSVKCPGALDREGNQRTPLAWLVQIGAPGIALDGKAKEFPGDLASE